MNIKVVVSGRGSRSKQVVPVIKEISDDFMMLNTESLKHLHKSWIKVSSDKFSLEATGGFLVKCTKDKAFLRVPAKKEIFEIDIIPEIRFYVKNDDPNYLSITELEVEKSKVKFMFNKLNDREQKLNKKIESFEKMQNYINKHN
jgi:chaperonin cofactor prefoldin